MTKQKALIAASWFVVGFVMGGVWWRMVGGSAHPAEVYTGYMIVGLKEPTPPAAIKALEAKLAGRVVRVAPRGIFVLVKPRPGITAAELQASSEAISYVEPEVVMSLVEPKRDALLVIESPKPPPKPVLPPPKKLQAP